MNIKKRINSMFHLRKKSNTKSNRFWVLARLIPGLIFLLSTYFSLSDFFLNFPKVLEEEQFSTQIIACIFLGSILSLMFSAFFLPFVFGRRGIYSSTDFGQNHSSKLLDLSKPSRNNPKLLSEKDLLFISALFIPASARDTALGDMEEIYKKDLKRFGARKAKWLMFIDICRSNYPWIKEAMRGKLVKVLKWAGLMEIVRRFLG